MDENTDICFGKKEWNDELRPATESEKMKLFEVLKRKNFRWNEEEKKLEKFRWRAEKGENYYYLTATLKVTHTRDVRYRVDNECYDSGNYFKTISEANEYAEKIQKLLKER